MIRLPDYYDAPPRIVDVEECPVLLLYVAECVLTMQDCGYRLIGAGEVTKDLVQVLRFERVRPV